MPHLELAHAPIPTLVTGTRRAGIDPAFVREAVKRATAQLAPFEAHIRDVVVSVTDVNGPKGGPDDKVCRVMVRLLLGGNPILAVGRDETHYAALNLALKRASRCQFENM